MCIFTLADVFIKSLSLKNSFVQIKLRIHFDTWQQTGRKYRVREIVVDDVKMNNISGNEPTLITKTLLYGWFHNYLHTCPSCLVTFDDIWERQKHNWYYVRKCRRSAQSTPHIVSSDATWLYHNKSLLIHGIHTYIPASYRFEIVVLTMSSSNLSRLVWLWIFTKSYERWGGVELVTQGLCHPMVDFVLKLSYIYIYKYIYIHILAGVSVGFTEETPAILQSDRTNLTIFCVICWQAVLPLGE